MADIGTILGHVTPRETTVRVCVDGAAAAAVERAIETVRSTARQGGDVEAAEAALAAARDALTAATYTFTFAALSAKERSDLIAAHPSDDKDAAWNAETLPPALVAACCADPAMSDSDAAELMNRLSEGDRAALFNAAWSVNYERTPVPFT